jgi:DNA-binding CsgD family transcriptional regulator
VAELTTREREVLALIAQGKRCRDIAASLEIAVYTVRKHRANICEKVGLHGTGQLAAYAIHQSPREVKTTNGPEIAPGTVVDLLAALSDREQHVLRLVGDGLSSKEIARRLLISPATVRKHRENIAKRLLSHGCSIIALLTYLAGIS